MLYLIQVLNILIIQCDKKKKKQACNKISYKKHISKLSTQTLFQRLYLLPT